jgi:hypothetical protein
MFATLLSFFVSATPYLALASNLLPILAIARSQNDPAVSNAGLLNTIKAIQFVQPIVAQVEAVSNAGPSKMSGPDKLQLFQTILQEAQAATAGQDNKLTETLPLLNAAVAAVCASMKTAPLTIPATTSATNAAVPAPALQNNA